MNILQRFTKLYQILPCFLNVLDASVFSIFKLNKQVKRKRTQMEIENGLEF